MAYLHENKEEFRNAVYLASERFHILPVVAEKDYYVTVILRGLAIPNIDETRSRRSYNRYILAYESVVSEPDDAVQSAVLMETSFAEVSFPTVVLPVHRWRMRPRKNW